MLSLDYHEATKHHFNRFARSSGYLDWATQPNPFRRFAGAPLVVLPHEAVSEDVAYEAIFERRIEPSVIDHHTVGEFLRCSMGLSAWKRYQKTRWALRVNPSSGNLHPTETYIVWNGRVHHYAPLEHALEERCVLDARAAGAPVATDAFLVGLTTIFWREAWKYGERAFRYCHHDLGHAIGALRLAAARLGWQMALLPGWSDRQVATLLGLDRERDFGDSERETGECLAIVMAGDPAAAVMAQNAEPICEAARRGTWTGSANRLSPGHVDWPAIDRVAEATVYPGSELGARDDGRDLQPEIEEERLAPRNSGASLPPSARAIILQRRSAVAFDARSALPAETFHSMLSRLRPTSTPFDAIDWTPQVHLAIFVHRVEGLTPGLYAFLRDPAVLGEWRAAMRPDFLWEQVPLKPGITGTTPPPNPDTARGHDLFLLLPMDVTWPAVRVSCDQDIAGDGFFSLGMIARLESSLRTGGNGSTAGCTGSAG